MHTVVCLLSVPLPVCMCDEVLYSIVWYGLASYIIVAYGIFISPGSVKQLVGVPLRVARRQEHDVRMILGEK